MLKFENSKLTKEELNELIGGEENGVSAPGDIANTNTVYGCLCKYNNSSSVITNTNKVEQCSCECKLWGYDEPITNKLC